MTVTASTVTKALERLEDLAGELRDLRAQIEHERSQRSVRLGPNQTAWLRSCVAIAQHSMSGSLMSKELLDEIFQRMCGDMTPSLADLDAVAEKLR